MLKIIKKIRKHNPSLQDFFCFINVYWIRKFIGFYSTPIFKLKALLFGIKGGKKINCYGTVILKRFPLSLITIGQNCQLLSSSSICSSGTLSSPVKLCTWKPTSKIILKDNVQLNGTSICARSTSITIENNVMIAPNVRIMDSDFHVPWPPEDRQSTPGFEHDKPIYIEKNVWIGSNTIILKGVTIGENSIIAAGSVVTKDIPKNVMAAGVPAKEIYKF